MGKESKIRKERRLGIREKVERKKDRFPIFLKIITIFIVIILIIVGSLTVIKNTNKGIEARVGSEKVLKSDVDNKVNNYINMYKQFGMDLTLPQYADTLNAIRKNSVNSLVEESLLVQYAKEKNIKADPEKLKADLEKEVQSAIEQSKGQFTNEEDFIRAVEAQYGSMDKFKAYLSDLIKPYVERPILAEDVLKPVYDKIKPIKEDIEKYFSSIGSVEAEHLLIKANSETETSKELKTKEKLAQDVYDEIMKKSKESGFDFAKFAKEKADSLNKEKEGTALYETLGVFLKNQMVKEFEEAAFSAKVGEIVGVIKTEYGFHIIHKINEFPVSKDYDQPEKVKARTIIFNYNSSDAKTKALALKKAEDTYAQLKKGLSFQTAVSKYSEDEATKAKGGIYDFFTEKEKPEIFKALNGFKVNEYTKPIDTGVSYHIVQLLERKAGSKASLSDPETYKKVEEAYINEQKIEAKRNLVEELKKKYKISYNAWDKITGFFDKNFGSYWKGFTSWLAKATGKEPTIDIPEVNVPSEGQNPEQPVTPVP